MRLLLLLSVALAACQAPLATTPRSSETPSPGAETRVVLKMGESRLLGDDFTISLVDVADSRCPADVACVWAGEAKAIVGPSHPTMRFRPDTLTLAPTRPGRRDSMQVGPFRVRLVGVTPLPRSDTASGAPKTATFEVWR